MSDTDPAWIEPMHEYFGFICDNCGHRFAITQPLDPIEFPSDKTLKVGVRGGTVPANCTHCGHLHEYSIEKLIRFSE